MVISTSNLTRRFGPLTAVDRLNLKVPRGCVYGFLGPNGAGKSTTIRMLLGLIKPNSGEVELFGRAMHKNRLAFAKRIGALVETPSLYSHLSGRENLEVTRRLAGINKDSIDKALQIVGLAEAAQRKVGTYSLGMKQRLGIALAFLGDPELLILDEPTNGLDPAGILEVRELIQSMPYKYGISVFISSHLLNEVEQIATNIAIIQAGRLKFQGTLKELQSQKQKRILVRVDNPSDAGAILKGLGYSAIPRKDLISINTSGTDEQTALINQKLVERGIKVFYLTVEQPSLEDLFLRLTSDEEGERP